MYRTIAGALVILFLASVARFYHPGTGFTALIAFPDPHEHVSAAMRETPHAHVPYPYDGQFYAQRALDPLLRDPAYDRAMDLAPYRGRRILFSWTAWALGLGRPAWILQAYALQNVLCWVLLALLLTRWIPPVTARGLALWIACLFSHGMLWSVRFALLDAPSLLLLAASIALIEKGRPLSGAVVTGLAGLGRETNVLALAGQPLPRDRRSLARLVVAGALAVLPLLVWLDYLRSIYRSTISSGAAAQLAMPGVAVTAVWQEVLLRDIPGNGLFSLPGLWLVLLISLAVQAGYLALRREYGNPWWRVGAAYALLMLLLDRTLADPDTGAITRVLLPMTVGFNILLAREPRGGRAWTWYALGNAHLIASPWIWR
jgi:hypothetical protein